MIQHQLVKITLEGCVTEDIIISYNDYINNKMEWEAGGSGEPTSRVVNNGYEEWEDTCEFDPLPFYLNESAHVYWMFDKEKIKNLDTENYPWENADHFMFQDKKFNTLESMFEYIVSLYAEGERP